MKATFLAVSFIVICIFSISKASVVDEDDDVGKIY